MWQTLKLKDIVNISIGKTPPRGDKRYWDKEKDTKNIWLSIADMNSATDGFVSDSKEYVSDAGAALFKSVPANTLIMSFKLSIGKLAFTACELRTNEAIAALAIKNENQITKEYLKYFLSSLNWDKIAGDDEKVKGKTLNKAKLKELEIVVPPLSAQRRIVSKLDAAFYEIDRMVNSSQFKQTEVKSLPAKLLKKILEDEAYGWTSERLSSIAVNLDAQRIPITKSKRTVGNIPYYGASGIVDYVSDFIFDEELLLISEDGANLLARTYPIAFSVEGKTWVNNHAHVLKFENKMLQKWVEYYLNSTNIETFISGMAQPKLNQKKLNEIPIPCPNLSLLPKLLSNFEQIALQSEIIFKLQTKKIEQIEKLKSVILAQELQSEAA